MERPLTKLMYGAIWLLVGLIAGIAGAGFGINSGNAGIMRAMGINREAQQIMTSEMNEHMGNSSSMLTHMNEMMGTSADNPTAPSESTSDEDHQAHHPKETS